MTPGLGHRECPTYLWPGPGGTRLAFPLTEGLERIRRELLKLLVLSLGLCHCFGFYVFSVPVKAYEDTPTCEENASANQDTCRVHQLYRVVMGGAKCCNESFNSDSDDDYEEEPRKEATNTRWTTNVDIAKNLFFRDSLGDLERHDCDGKQANRFNDLLRSRVIKTACEGDPSLLRSNDDKYQRGAGKDGRHTGVNDRVDEQ